jgi:hypothetical protein
MTVTKTDQDMKGAKKYIDKLIVNRKPGLIQNTSNSVQLSPNKKDQKSNTKWSKHENPNLHPSKPESRGLNKSKSQAAHMTIVRNRPKTAQIGSTLPKPKKWITSAHRIDSNKRSVDLSQTSIIEQEKSSLKKELKKRDVRIRRKQQN